ncbi:tRNA 2-thiocytidine(32) synthetase TtcA, partial [Burkholderia cenocepacia]|nr:tRNA 2-thiocytidine(32) synthetase TtcA [Burkholderia cenocepacia]
MNAPHMNDTAADATTAETGRPALTRREQKEAYENNKLFKRIVRQV